jgi:DNA-binding beta-propeller fold protein YncE
MVPINTASTTTNTAGPAIPVGKQPNSLVITPDGRTAYVSGRSTITPVELATGRPGPPISVGPGTYLIAFTMIVLTPERPAGGLVVARNTGPPGRCPLRSR